MGVSFETETIEKQTHLYFSNSLNFSTEKINTTSALFVCHTYYSTPKNLHARWRRPLIPLTLYVWVPITVPTRVAQF
jgi:hypothetical protein